MLLYLKQWSDCVWRVPPMLLSTACLVMASSESTFARPIYQLAVGDKVRIQVFGRADLNHTATVDSTATNTPGHIPTPPGTSFQKPPANRATIKIGSPTVRINGKMAARNGDMALTCNDPSDLPVGTVIAVATVNIG